MKSLHHWLLTFFYGLFCWTFGAATMAELITSQRKGTSISVAYFVQEMTWDVLTMTGFLILFWFVVRLWKKA